MSHEAPRLERARRSLLGLSVGDAFGGTFFWKPDLAARIQARELASGTWTWSDDTAMAKSVFRCLELHAGIEAGALARLFGEEYFREPTRGYGTMAHTVLHELGRGVPWQQAATEIYDGMGSCGNGAAMRAGPVGAYFAGDVEKVVTHARQSALVTHAHPEGQAGAIAVASAAAWAAEATELDGVEMLRWAWSQTPEGITRDNLEQALNFPLDRRPEEAAALLGSGQRVTAQDTVPFALWCAARHLNNYSESLWAAVAGHGDMDTTCAIIGSIVALCDPQGIPKSWLDQTEPLGEDPPREVTFRRGKPSWSQWDGLTRSEMMSPDLATYRHQLFDAAERYDWDTVFGLLDKYSPDSHLYKVNLVRPNDPSWRTLLHHAVLGDASKDVAERLVCRGHFRSIRCAAGERPVDLARRLGRDDLLAFLEPVVEPSISEKKLQALQTQFHELILQDPSWRQPKHNLRLPPLDLLLEREDLTMTFLVPAMWGGFVYRLQRIALPAGMWATSEDWVLLAKRYERMGEGSERNFVVTAFGSLLVRGDDEHAIFT